MLTTKIYINGLSSISPQPTFNDTINSVEDLNFDFTCKEPDYKLYFTANALRRYSRILKIAITTAIQALKDANLEHSPDAILTGTGLGCLSDTEKFLNSILELSEENLSPTSFIFSTHNTISGQIALATQCKNINNTFSNRYFSFESALQESIYILSENHKKTNILVGAADEKTQTLENINQNLGTWISPNDTKSIMGEGACYFVISNQPSPTSYAELIALELKYELTENENITSYINSILKKYNLSSDDIDLVITGSLDSNRDGYEAIYDIFKNSSFATYKNHIGNNFTASAFGLYLASCLLKTQLQDSNYFDINLRKNIRLVLTYNHSQGKYHSISILKNV